MHLDLENPTPWWTVIGDDSEGRAAVLELCRRNNHLVSSIAAYGELPGVLARALDEFVRSARGKIQSVAAYHGCRVIDESSYRFGGIHRLRAAELIDWCKTFFGHEAKVEKICADLGTQYIEHGESAVFCMRGIEPARRNSCVHHEGSEFVRNIAARLGPTSEQKYYAVGKPCFVEVCIPIKWFDCHSRGSVDCLLRNVFVHWLWIELSLERPGDPRDGAIIFGADIPAEYVKTFHYVD